MGLPNPRTLGFGSGTQGVIIATMDAPPPPKKSKKAAAKEEAAAPDEAPAPASAPAKWESTIAGLVPALGNDRGRLAGLLVDHPTSTVIVHTVLQEMGKAVPEACTEAEAAALTGVLGGVCSECPAACGLAILAVPTGDMGEGREAAKALAGALTASACRFPTWTRFALKKASKLAEANSLSMTTTLKYIKRTPTLDEAFIAHAIHIAEATEGGVVCSVAFA